MAIDAIPDVAGSAIGLDDASAVLPAVREAETLLILGFGFDLPTAQEAALKDQVGAWQ